MVLVAGLMVFALAGCSSSKSKTTSSGGQSAGGGVTVTTAVASAGPTIVNVEGGEKPDGKYYLTVTPASVQAGPTTITFKNVGTKEHEVVVLKTDTPADKLKVGANHEVSEAASVGEDSETKPGKTKSTTIDLQPGTYVLVCNIERHYEKGMYGALTVT
ncbi:MAG TPA: plastocyanin/azurin family copper-binding protein [Actinomycetes bacterium]|nr:plastocyanin/azurin family copper-binding protein [Actinomycetes bacterium]